MRILNLFAKIIAERKESCKNIQRKARFLANLLSSVFYLSISIFISYPFLLSFNFYLCRFQFSFYTFRKCSSSFSLGMSAVSW